MSHGPVPAADAVGDHVTAFTVRAVASTAAAVNTARRRTTTRERGVRRGGGTGEGCIRDSFVGSCDQDASCRRPSRWRRADGIGARTAVPYGGSTGCGDGTGGEPVRPRCTLRRAVFDGQWSAGSAELRTPGP